MEANIVLIPGAWTGAWGWNTLEYYLESSNHAVYSLTLSGLASDSDNELDVSDIDLEQHITDVITFLESNDLVNVILIGHSYSGIVVGLVASKLQERIKRLVFIEAFLPVAGKSLLESADLNVEEEIKAIKNNNGRWPAPTRAELAGQSFLKEEDKEWLSKNLIGHPGKTVTDKVPMNISTTRVDSTYIGGRLPNVSDERFSDMEFIQLEGGHWPMITAPEKLAELLNDVASRD